MRKITLVIIIICFAEILFGQNNYFPQETLNQLFVKQKEILKHNSNNYVQFMLSDKTIYDKIYAKRKNVPKYLGNYSQKTNDLKSSITVGPGADTLKITDDTFFNQGINVIGAGVLMIDGAGLTISGSLSIADNGKCFVFNNGKLTFYQSFIGEMKLILFNNAYFEATDAIIDANGSTRSEEFYDNSTYKATRTYFPDWTFRKAFNHAQIYFDMINSDYGTDNYTGDMLIYDSVFVHYKNCDVLWPWLQVSENGNIGTPTANFTFPSIQFVNHFEFPGDHTNVSGINYKIIIDSSTHVWWGLDTYPGSNTYLSNCVLIGSAQRLYGTDPINLYGIHDSTFYSGTLPLPDRTQQYQNVFVRWWCWYPRENTILNIDSCYFGEMVAWDNSIVNITRSSVEGTEQLAAKDNGFVSFSDGIIHSFVNAYHHSTLFINNSYVTPVGGSPISHQHKNYSHGFAYLLCTNTKFDFIPEALDGSEIMYLFIDSIGTINPDTVSKVPIVGSAWIASGPLSNKRLAQYKLYYQFIDSTSWVLINSSSVAVNSNILGDWNVNELSNGEYFIKLTLIDTNHDSISALRNVNIDNPTSVNDYGMPNTDQIYLYQNYPNPFNPTTTIKYTISSSGSVALKLYDVLGKEVSTLVNGYKNAGTYQLEFDASNLPSGIYFYKIQFGTYSSARKLIFVK